MWTRFMDMHSGGRSKEKYDKIYIEAPEDEAKIIFYNRFGHNPERVSCTCCGEDYSISSEEDLAQLTGFDRNLRCVETKRDPETGLYLNDDPNVRYLEEDEQPPEGYTVSDISMIGRRYGKTAQTLAEYLDRPDIMVIKAGEIDPAQRKGSVPRQGYVWCD